LVGSIVVKRRSLEVMIKRDDSNDHDPRFGRGETENIREWSSLEILQRRYLNCRKMDVDMIAIDPKGVKKY
jgi:hypothetical protein